MRIVIFFLLIINFAFAKDATIDVIKKIDSKPTVLIEDSSLEYDEKIKKSFFKAFATDLDVLSIFDVDKNYKKNDFDAQVTAENSKTSNLTIRYKLSKDLKNGITLDLKIISNSNVIYTKSYKVNNQNAYIFLSHNVAYDINQFMGEEAVEWIKKRVIFSRMVSPQKSEIVIADYSLQYQHVVVKGGFNIFPKWANKEQNAFYYTSMDERKPTLKLIDIKNGKTKNIKSSDGMIVCSDVSGDSKKLLLTMAPDGQPDIYQYDIDTGSSIKLSEYGGIDVGGQFLQNDSVVFISDRLGYPNVFKLDIKSKKVESLVGYGKNNSACSVFGDKIIYKARESSELFTKNTFNLHMISSKSDTMRRLTTSGVNEFPKFSTDGDAVIFIKNTQTESSVGVIKLKQDKSYLFPLNSGKIQSIDW